ncbi:unnamed protein product [Rodentolepis nana]|uniref:SH2 domain-containing protein n=1 Tax=Rodentolepis nana TaxID=102285 RepID=A0A3P7U1U1_RODNA|nr:unnamed protein product [Rodentolepis nana]
MAKAGGGQIRPPTTVGTKDNLAMVPVSGPEFPWGPPTERSMERNRRDLAAQDWYWGDVSRAEVSEIMRGQSDGAFLVRDSTQSGNVNAFTLTEKRNFSTILFRIFHRGDSFDISDPPSPGFPLISDLIAYYQKKARFASLDAPYPRLIYPVKRNSPDLLSSLLISSPEQIIKILLTTLRSASVELNRRNILRSDFENQMEQPSSQYFFAGRFESSIERLDARNGRDFLSSPGAWPSSGLARKDQLHLLSQQIKPRYFQV